MPKISTVCVYCGSSFGRDPRYREEIVRLGQLLAQRKFGLIYGGGGVGLMGALAEAALEAGGDVIGVIPDFLKRAERQLKGLTRLEVVTGMHERKSRMFALADAFVAMPGGFGTLDETIEVLTWKQLGLHDKPIVLVDFGGFWQPVIAALEHAVEQKFAHGRALEMMRIVPDVDAAIDYLSRAKASTAASAAPEKL
jgi:uncharacterized protein (TIGR00730 family)